MTIPPNSAKDSVPPAINDITEPTKPGTSMKYNGGQPLWKFILWYTLTSVAFYAIWQSITTILLPNQVQNIEFGKLFTGADAAVDLTLLNNLKVAVENGHTATVEQQRLLGLLTQFDASRGRSLALVTTLGVLATILIQPIIGVLSDRTRSHLGRRTPWLLFGGVVGALFLGLMGFAPNIAILTLAWIFAQVILNIAFGPLTATVADRIPEAKLGIVSTMGGLASFLGGISGSVVAGLIFARLGLNTYFVFSAFLAIAVIGFVFINKDRSSTALEVPKVHWGNFLSAFIQPLKDRDFRLVWLARVILYFGYSASTALSFYMLQSYIQPGLSAAAATKILPFLGMSGAPGMLIGIFIVGKLSTKMDKRKPFVITASILMATSFVVPLLWPSLTAMFIQAAMSGLAAGFYLPVDQALLIEVLPDRKDAGRDLGVAALGLNLGQALGPIISGQIVALSGSYRLVWLVALIPVITAALIIMPVKRVG